ncbi:MAG: D-alanyl-D-alanine carboxypeptidase [Alphaproteobacteria bacterium]|jgi:D-alanyl-D-alanine carboxypeptidase|nr:D-alanyl-D-alanine carboxypeptidase [Alphaproteobacteria bacterium]MBT4082303.1 D-alanyl-D-alanine carboxypeptidase [Alphaproteobacteria bacterium]MBT4542796.1 D-alanyl-D-alanine carboxypeptidase [Alphaproteobacteria bacterium]MBT7744224.1 D-alanyl-D-alanine carboxypeptidase [Alphaproteobacteria bacterium]
MTAIARSKNKWMHGISKTLCVVSVFAAVLLSGLPSAQARVSSIVIDADTGEVLYSRRADQRRYPASLTKMMTLYQVFTALENGKLKLDQKLKVSRRAAGQTPSKLGLKRGSRISVEKAIIAVAVKSANDAATVLAESLGETEFDFALRMTDTARSLGMKSTRFQNASGLPNRRQRTTARDIALLSKALIDEFPQYYHYFSIRSFKWGKRTHRTHNRLLEKYRGMDGLKTGYIRASGFNIATSAVKGDRRLIAVLLGGRTAKKRDSKVAFLMNASFNRARTLDKHKGKKASPLLIARNKSGDTDARRGEQVAKRGKPAKTIPLPRLKPGYDTTDKKEPEAFTTILARTIKSLIAPETADAAPSPEDGKSWWGIQVGAYKRYASAQRRLHLATNALPDVLLHARPSIDRVPVKGGEVYRARLLGLRKVDAASACKILKRKAFSCVAISPEGDQVVKMASR